MASPDSLPADQRAVLQLVLQRGRSYDDIAALLAIDRAAVRERALSALDALGPDSELDPTRRALITDYLLGQLPPAVSEDIRSRLAASPGERAWARVVAAELTPLANRTLPEIPSPEASPPSSSMSSSPPGAEPTPRPPREQVPADGPAPRESDPDPTSAAEGVVSPEPRPGHGGSSRRKQPSSRRGGAIVLGAGLLAVVVVVVILITDGGSASHKSTKASTTGATASSGSTATSTSATAQAKPVAQVTLTSPTGSKNVGGVAVVVKQGANEGLVIRAQGIPANTTHDAYAVWLYNSPTDNHILGFVNPGVKANGVLQTAGVLPTGAAHYKQLLVTLETQSKPRSPSKIVLQGALSLSS